MKQTVICCAVVKVGPGCLTYNLNECFLMPGDGVFACAIRLQNTCVYARALIRSYVPSINELAANFRYCPQGWEFRAAGNLTL